MSQIIREFRIPAQKGTQLGGIAAQYVGWVNPKLVVKGRIRQSRKDQTLFDGREAAARQRELDGPLRGGPEGIAARRYRRRRNRSWNAREAARARGMGPELDLGATPDGKARRRAQRRTNSWGVKRWPVSVWPPPKAVIRSWICAHSSGERRRSILWVRLRRSLRGFPSPGTCGMKIPVSSGLRRWPEGGDGRP